MIKLRDRVKMTDDAIRGGLHSCNGLPIESSSTGILISILPNGHYRVLRDRRKAIETYHPSFWEKEIQE